MLDTLPMRFPFIRFWRMQLSFICSKDTELFFPRGRRTLLWSLLQWSWVSVLGPTIHSSRPEKVTVILLNHKRSWNMEMIVRSLLKCAFVEKIIVCNNGAKEPVYSQRHNARVHVVTLTENGKPIQRFVLAAQESAEFFLFIDDDVFLFPKQIRKIFLGLLEDTSCIHGICGERFSQGKMEHYLYGSDMKLDNLNRVYACTSQHVATFFVLLGALKKEHAAIAPFRDDILLSASGREKPLCHDVGDFLSCPSSTQHNIAVFRSDGFAVETRLSFYESVRISKAIEHLYGPSSVACTDQELTVVCLVRNGEPYVHSFIQHYQNLGTKHIVLLDNGSEDQTVQIASQYNNVSIFRCTLPFETYQLPMKRWLVEKWCTKRWCLCVDIDELFLFPHAEKINLQSFLAYLNEHKYTAVVAHMLDMFADAALSEIESHPEDDLKQKYPFYDLSNIQKINQEKQAQLTNNQGITCFSGGIRKTLFGSDHFLLTKMPLFFVDDGLEIFPHTEHFVENAYCADVTGVLLHYKFIGGFKQRVQHAVDGQYHWGNSLEYKLYANALKQHPNLSPFSQHAQRWQSTDALVNQGFLEDLAHDHLPVL